MKKIFVICVGIFAFVGAAIGATPKGSTYIDHPDAAQGLMRIEADGTYVYKTPKAAESKRSGSARFAVLSAPSLQNDNIGRDFEDYYGSDPLIGFLGSYAFPLTRGSLALSVDIEAGLAFAQGDGYFNRDQSGNSDLRSVESYTLFLVPVSVLLTAKFQFSDKQWFVPFISGGPVVYGLAELRSDEENNNFAATFGGAAGGGVLISVTRWAPASAFQLRSEYGINDLWVHLEGRAVIGFDENIDISQNLFSMGATFDF